MDIAAAYLRKRWYIGLAVAGVCVALVIGAAIVWQLLRPAPLLPAGITQKITGFTPYFYVGSVPADYSVDQSKAVYESQVLMVPLSRPDGTSVVITEQTAPQSLTDQAVQQNGEQVAGAAGKATINNVEGRLVGTLLSWDRKTLVLLSAPDDKNKDDLKALLQGLRPL